MYFFSIPDSFVTRIINLGLFDAMQQHKDWFYDDFILETAYGCPFFCIWNGNRGGDGFVSPSALFVKMIYGMYAKENIQYGLTFTNFLLKPEHLHDLYSNKFAEILSINGGYVTVSTQLMANYMKKKYPSLQVVWSANTEYRDGVASINEKTDEGDIVTLPIDHNGKWEYIQQLQNPEKIEILVNENCIDNCPRRKEHFTYCSKGFLLETTNIESKCFFPEDVFPEMSRTRCVSRNEIPIYAKYNINHFKIVGRQSQDTVMHAYDEYFVLPEYVDEFNNFVNTKVENSSIRDEAAEE